ncbi:MAG: hypothetical protein ABFD80_05295 [Acidobacteriota bacterium]
MNKTLKILVIFLAVDAIALGAYFGLRAMSGGRAKPQDGYAWVMLDENYAPANSIEQYIKDDAAAKGLLPVYLRNYGRNVSVLKRFQGGNFAGANEAVLEMAYRGLQDWMLVDLKYKDEKERDIERTLLYIELGGQWKVADSGRLRK